MKEQYEAFADQMADQYGLDRNLYRRLVAQESRWDPQATSPRGAFGLTQIMPETAAKPGHGVKPLADDSWQEQLRFGAEFFSALRKKTGSDELAAAAYNGGYGNVLKHKGVPPFPETQDYVRIVTGQKELSGAAPSAARQTMGKLEKFEALKAAVLASPAVRGGAPMDLGSTSFIADQAAKESEARLAERAASAPTAGEVFASTIYNETVTGAVGQLIDSGPVDADFQPSREEATAALGQFGNDARTLKYVMSARNKEDFEWRKLNAKQQTDLMTGMANATGLKSAQLNAAMFGGAVFDPVGFAVTAPFALLGNGAKAAQFGRSLRVLGAAAEGAASEATVQAYLDYALRDEVDGGALVASGLMGAAFGTALSLPIQARRAGIDARLQTEFDAGSTALGAAIDADAPQTEVARLQANIEDIKTRAIALAEAEGDQLAAEVWNAAGAGATAQDITTAIRALNERRNGVNLDPVHEAPNPIIRTIDRLTEGTETAEVRGMRLTSEATAVRQYAYDLWKEEVDPALKDMQARMQKFYSLRESKVANYAGLSNWLDSPGLRVQLSKSRVARMLGANLFESATGLGKREQTAALNYEVLHSRLAHNYIPDLKESLVAALREEKGALIGHVTGAAGGAAERKFWRAVMAERTAHRNAIRAKQEFASTAPEAVRKAAHTLDKFWGEAASHMEKLGLEEGTAIRSGGIVGHVPYNWDAKIISKALREDPETFDAFQSMIQEEFRDKVLGRAMDRLSEDGIKHLDKRRADLEGNIAAIQEEIGKLEKARETVDTARDTARDIDAKAKELKALRDELLEAQRKLEEEFKDAPDEVVLDPITVESQTTEKDDFGLNVTTVRLSDGTEHRVFKLSSAESMGLPGWHDDVGFLADTKKDAIIELLRRANERPDVTPEAAVEELATERIASDVRDQVGYVSSVFTGNASRRALEADPAYTQFTGADLLAQIGNNARLSPAARLMHAALVEDFGDSAKDLAVFVSSKSGRSHYNGAGHYVKMDGVLSPGLLTESAAETALHELAHARTSNWLNLVEMKVLGRKVTRTGSTQGKLPTWADAQFIDDATAAKHPKYATAIKGWNKLERVRGELLARFPELVGQETGVGYAMMNNHELISQVFNSQAVRDALEAITLPGDDMSLLRRVWEAVVEALTNKQGTALQEVVEALDLISGQQGTWSMGMDGGTAQFGPTVRTKGQIKEQLDAIKEQKLKVDAEREALKVPRKEAAAQRKAVNATENALKLKNLRLQLDNQKARLADMQRDPLGWWAGEIAKLRNAAETKADALTSSYLKQVIDDPENRAKGATLRIARLAEDLLVENWAGKGINEQLAEDFATLLKERISDKTRTEFDLGRSRTVNGKEVSLMDFMELDGLAQVKSNAHRVAGRASLARMGIKDDVGVAAAMEAARTDGATPEELKSLQFGFDFLTDNLGVSDHAAMHALRNMTYFTRMGKLGMSIIADVPQMVSTLGLGLALKTWAKSFGQLGLRGAMEFNGKPTAFAKQMAKVAPGALGRDHRLMTTIPDDPATGVADVRAASTLQRVSMRGAQLTSYLSGANSVNMAMHRALLPVLAEEVVKAVRGKSAITDARLADMGMDTALIERVRAQMDKHDAGRREGDAINWKAWDDQPAADALIAAIHRGMYQTLQKSLLGERQEWLVTSGVGRLIGQFRSFGLTAAEKLAGRNMAGFQDNNTLIAGAMGLLWGSLAYYARVHTNALGKDDKEAYIDEQLQPLRLARGVLTMWSMSGLGADVVGVGELLFGGSQPGGSGPAAVLGTVQDIAKAASAAGGLVTGDTTGKEAAKAGLRLLPGANSVPFTVLLNELGND